MMRLPDFVVLGQGKAGTSLVYRVLGRNPDVGLSHPKELHYYTQHYDKGLNWYLAHFDHVTPDALRLGEVCPSYLDPEAVARIHDTLGPDAGMIFILRHPIEQAYSRYLQNICASRGRSDLAFDAAHILRNRFEQLHAALSALYDRYAPDRILALNFEKDIDVDAPPFEARICRFLGLPESDHMRHFSKRGKVNAGVMPRFVYGGADGQTLQCEGESYTIPPRELVFCAQPRNSAALGRTAPEEADAARSRAAGWTDAITVEEFADLQETLVLPFAERLERDFGIDLAHWRNDARRIAYDPAPPPAQFMAEGSA